jgi:hypothetical protein
MDMMSRGGRPGEDGRTIWPITGGGERPRFAAHLPQPKQLMRTPSVPESWHSGCYEECVADGTLVRSRRPKPRLSGSEYETMLRSLQQIIGYAMGAVDGEIGKVRDFLFDDHAWTVRYLVADTGKWVPGRKVLISPAALVSADWLDSVLETNLTRKEIEQSPPIESDKPVSRQKEVELTAYYAWPVYWPPMSAPLAGPGVALPLASIGRRRANGTPTEDGPHLRSVKEVTGYRVIAMDGELGHIDDFIGDDETWTIRCLVVDTARWWPGKKVLLIPQRIVGISWDTRHVRFDISKAAVEAAPPYDPSRPINREYEMVLYDYYGRPHYRAPSAHQTSRG